MNRHAAKNLILYPSQGFFYTMKINEAITNASTKPALMTHVVAGFPGKDESKRIIEMMANVADVIEIQIPFSDPVADGPTMMKCNEKALDFGFKVDDAFTMASDLKDIIKTPLLFMTYFNIVFKRGVEQFCKDAKAAGIKGVIIPDMPIDEEHNEHFLQACNDHELDWVPVISPITPAERIEKMAKYAGGFWYAVSRTGVTGARDEFSAQTASQIEEIKKHSDLPVSLAFGVSKAEHVTAIGELADMAVVGSAVQNIFLRDEFGFEENLAEAEQFLRGLRE